MEKGHTQILKPRRYSPRFMTTFLARSMINHESSDGQIAKEVARFDLTTQIRQGH